MIFVGADHGGYELKEEILKLLDSRNIKYTDFGTNSSESVDYPDYAIKVAKKVNGDDLGILICGTGIGMSITANKVKGIRAALCHNEYTARMAREHNNANILCIGGRVVEKDMGKKIVNTFLDTSFSKEERHHRRVKKMDSC